MNTRCPHCQTSYTVDAEILRQAQGMARCFNCGKVFDAFANSLAPAAAEPPPETPPEPQPKAEFEPEDEAPVSDEAVAQAPGRLPEPPSASASGSGETLDSEALFSLPEEFEPIAVDDHVALDLDDALTPGNRSRTPVWQLLVGMLLLLLLLAQVAWWQRVKLSSMALLKPLYQQLGYTAPQRRAPQMFQIVERSLSTSQNHPGALRLQVRLVNNASFAQPLPDMVITFSSVTGQVVIRRTFTPSEYLFPAPDPHRLVSSGGVISINLLFEDPGVLDDSYYLDFR